MCRNEIWARRLRNIREHTGDLIKVFCQWAMWHWASRSGENAQRRFGFFQKDNFCFDHRQQSQWVLKLPQTTIRRNFYSGKAVTRHASNQCHWWKIVFSLKAGGDSRLHHHMLLHVHKDGTDAPTLAGVANDFVGEKENRKQLLEKISANDIPKKFSISSKSTQTEN